MGNVSGKPSSYTPSSHTHDDRYFTESEINTKLSGYSTTSHTHSYLPLSGGTMTGTTFVNQHRIVLANSGSTYYGYLTGNNAGTTFLCGINYLNLMSSGIQCRNSADTAWSGISASGFHNQSSKRYKENILDITEERINKIYDVDVKTYDYKENVVDKHEKDRVGVIAEDVIHIIEEAVNMREVDGVEVPDIVDYTVFVPYLIGAVQQQKKEIDLLKEELEAIKIAVGLKQA